MIEFLYNTGVRIGEFCGLVFDDINFDNQTGKIRREITKS
jgi:integrase